MELSKHKMKLYLPLLGFWSKIFFYKMFLICSEGLKIDFQNRKWNYPNRKWNYFSTFQATDEKTSFTISFSFVPRVSQLISKQEMELSKQEMELFLILPGLWLKNFFSKTFLIFTKDINIDFQIRKWNYLNRKWNYFSYFQASDQKPLLHNVCHFHLFSHIFNFFNFFQLFSTIFTYLDLS